MPPVSQPTYLLIFLTSTVVATVLSSLINFLINRYQKKQEFAYDFRKYILEKRKLAYDEIESFIEFSKIYKTTKPGYVLNIFRKGEHRNPVYEVNQWITKILKHSFWMSEEMKNLMLKYREMSSNIHVEIREVYPFPTQEEIYPFAIKYHDKVKKLNTSIEKTFIRDIVNLNDINNFKRSKLLSLEKSSLIDVDTISKS